MQGASTCFAARQFVAVSKSRSFDLPSRCSGGACEACNGFDLADEGIRHTEPGSLRAVVIVHLTFHRPYIFGILLEGINVHHPTENLRHKPAAVCLAILAG